MFTFFEREATVWLKFKDFSQPMHRNNEIPNHFRPWEKEMKFKDFSRIPDRVATLWLIIQYF